MKKTKIFLCLLISFIAVPSFAQNLKEDAEYYFEAKDYKKAYELYDKLFAQNPKNLDFKFRLGFSALHYPEKKARAIEIFEDIKREDKSPEADYYLAKAYHVNYRFDDAINEYELYIAAKGDKLKQEDKMLLDDARLGVKNCYNGKELIAKKVIADIKNIGGPINTKEHEYVPVISTDESVIIYTYVGEKSTGGLLNDELKEDKAGGTYHEDIFISTRSNDSVWSQPTGISSLNTKANDASVALSPDGQILFTFVSDVKNPGDLYMSTLNGTEWSKPEKLNSNINSEYWEGSCSITADGRYLYFASERPGGLGGRDLWVSEKVNGDWGPAQNLGPTINTEYNEDAPFIHPDGITMFFSSEGHKSIGGYDIMYSIKQENSWLEPFSMGIPLNTTEDDRYYVINAKGERGYFSSNRGGTGGFGGQDIYMVEPGILGEKPILALLKGVVYADDKPTEAKIEVIKKSNSQAIGPYYANSKTGKYLMALTPGNGYKISVTVAGFETVSEDIDVEKLQKFVEIKKDFYVYSPNYVHKKDQKSVKSILDSILTGVASVETFKNDASVNNIIDANSKAPEKNEPKTEPVKNVTLSPCNGSPIPDFSSLKGKSLNDPANYKQLMELGGSACAEGMVFKVQIAAYRNPENYKYNHLKEFGKPEIKEYPDGITRFTLQQFATLKEAEAVRQRIISKGQNDAWITAFIDGKRYTLEELILVNFLGKSVN